MREASAGKDTITGHWEMAGLVTETAMATFPNGFPPAITTALAAAAGRGLLGNKTASGTAIIDELGPQHMKTGDLILYTSADSVLQIAAHEEIVPLAELYRICEAARLIADQHHIGRVIARPFVGPAGRVPAHLQPPRLRAGPARADAAGRPARGRAWTWSASARSPTSSPGAGLSSRCTARETPTACASRWRRLSSLDRGLLFVNLVDFDMLYGHRNDVAGFARALAELDAWLPSLHAALKPDDAVFITADHGNDPTTPGTDHTRERVPLLAFGPARAPRGARARAPRSATWARPSPRLWARRRWAAAPAS